MSDDVLEGIGVVELGKVDDGIVGGVHTCYLTDEFFCLLIDGCPILHLCYLLEDTYDETAHLALRLIEVNIALQLFTHIAADGIALTVEVLGQTVDGIIHKLIEAETEATELLPEGFIDGLAFLCLQPVHDAGDELC